MTVGGETPDLPRSASSPVVMLAMAAFISGLCSIVYELLIATTTSYFLGDGVMYFSLTIGLYMAAMGAGTFCSRFVGNTYVAVFAWSEIALSWLGGLSVPLLYAAYTDEDLLLPVYAILTISIGFIIGMEIPFLTRLMEHHRQLKINISNVLSLDYLGALVATLAFPFVLLPWIGVFQTSIAFGLVNLTIALIIARQFRNDMPGQATRVVYAAVTTAILLCCGFLWSHKALGMWEQSLYADRIIHSERSRYQQIIMTRDKTDVRLYLDGNLQFSSIDEYRYHEALVEVPLALANEPPRHVLLLGAGDGLAARQLLQHPSIETITIVELDEAMLNLAKRQKDLVRLNNNSLQDDRVKIVNADAFQFVRSEGAQFDLIIADLPDPNSTSMARLYSRQFYTLIKNRLAPGGQLVTQATSPYFAPDAFWCITETVKAAGFTYVRPYHAYVPSFGDWGFVLASTTIPRQSPQKLPDSLRFLSPANFASLFVFDKDVTVTRADINEIDRPVLLQHYLGGWERYK